jgi:hypothetical protein
MLIFNILGIYISLYNSLVVALASGDLTLPSPEGEGE